MRPAFTRDPLFKKGLKVRKAVVGADYVERRLAAASEHDWLFEEAATKFAWGSVWNRPGLSRKMRSLLNIAALTAMNLRHELKLHIRAGLATASSGRKSPRRCFTARSTAVFPRRSTLFDWRRKCSTSWTPRSTRTVENSRPGANNAKKSKLGRLGVD